jgi:hypothetical protein
VERIAGWPDSDALVAGVAGRPVAAVECGRLLRLNTEAEMGSEDFEAALQAHEWSGLRVPLWWLHELAATIHHRDGYTPGPGSLLNLWDLRVRCGALLAMFMVGQENAGYAGSLTEYVRAWHKQRIITTHAAWHIADGNPDPSTLRRHPARRCSPEAYMTVWALAGRTTDMDPMLSEAVYWLRAEHRLPGTAA